MEARANDYATELARELKAVEGTVKQDGVLLLLSVPLDQKENILVKSGTLSVILARVSSSTYVSFATRGCFHHCYFDEVHVVLPPTAACQQPYLSVRGLLSTTAVDAAAADPAKDEKVGRKRKKRDCEELTEVVKRARSAAREEGLAKLMDCIKHDELKHGHASALANFLYDVQMLQGGRTKMTVHATHEFADAMAKKHIVTVREYERVKVDRLLEVCSALQAVNAKVNCTCVLLHFEDSPAAYAFRFEIDLP